ncbi:MAG: RnfABCDGE type electron transport complex subunit B [Candidatus Omnitrophica bacterium]|nr:RnfABCDGE type electron transport complex subunit B [Candidatus Omnitrophota bacterium]MBU1871687.1 RnfABCDGE type electron transport complex subunit B [Candidatus Omnitrophota bacterium]
MAERVSLLEIVAAILVLGSLGLLFGLGLAIASKKFCVAVDPHLEKIISCLPGANCGACGMPGCMGFAQSLLKGEVALNSCRAIDEDSRKKVARILGVELQARVRQVAVLHCAGGKKVGDKFQYNGLEDCLAADLVLGGGKECVYGCLGFVTCKEVCPFEAITMSSEALPVVAPLKCRACGKCVEACPKKLFSLIPASSSVVVACNSHDTGRDVQAVCPVGCIACRKCEKACKFDAIHVVDNLAVIDYNKCTSCGECVKVCPTKCIIIPKANLKNKEI